VAGESVASGEVGLFAEAVDARRQVVGELRGDHDAGWLALGGDLGVDNPRGLGTALGRCT
jgi:hypothetical protein